MGRSNIHAILGSQRSVLNRIGICYIGETNWLGSIKFLNLSSPSPITCTYCFEPGHASNSCYIKNCGVPKGEFKWVPKETTKLPNTKGSKFNLVPTPSP